MNGVTDLTSEPHWITEIYVVDQTGAIVEMKTLETEGVDVAKMEFKVAEGTETLQAYAWCSKWSIYVFWYALKWGCNIDNSTIATLHNFFHS